MNTRGQRRSRNFIDAGLRRKVRRGGVNRHRARRLKPRARFRVIRKRFGVRRRRK